MNTAIESVFWLLIGVAAYVYIGYPALLVALGAIIRRPVRRAQCEPTVSMLVAAYNEADIIEAKLRNALALDYPSDRLEIVVASDGSTDGTAAIARRFAEDTRVRICDYPVRRGKLATLNATVPELRGDIIVLSDASSMLAGNALRELAANLADPTVGAVSGVYKVRDRHAAELGDQEGLYWRYETFLKTREARIGSVLGAHGSLYAVRKSLYPFPDSNAINDDFVIPARIVARGYRVAYEPGAVAYESALEMSGFGRRVRIMAGNLAQLGELKRLVRPPRIQPLFVFLSHKVGRMVVPFALVMAAVLNVLLIGRPVYVATASAQALFYLLAVLGSTGRLRPRALRLPYYFCLVNAAVFVAALRPLLSGDRVAWRGPAMPVHAPAPGPAHQQIP